ncbi:hypothetical protein BN59_00641 [Legionella massiliensis]|uniref:ShET2 enterotoxin N-terminal domain-containing protein n=1 Tax=Legionella massiliensis TaxID=1034943 RepID=A0A078KTT6_9GAMM|nr:ShET2/EspL2 family type III secretion system effector toxin [Legionella massiliensis]CDZ76372.1 hypothetical protein BN59_00641 [Legionella massiliensis]CEE12110.1 hypothetical protein BN1094_00641 [Legionella massiliensis]
MVAPSQTSSELRAKAMELLGKGRRVTKLGSEHVIYKSKNGKSNLNLNGQAKDIYNKEIECRQLAYYVVQNDMKNYHNSLSSEFGISNIDSLRRNIFDSEKLMYAGSYYYFTDYRTFGNALYDVSENLSDGERTSFLVNSSVHSMAVTIKRHGPNYIVKFYDPNETSSHIRALCLNREIFRNLEFSDFCNDARSHFRESRHMTLISYDKNRYPEKSVTTTRYVDEKEKLFSFLRYGLNEQLKDYLQENASLPVDVLEARIGGTPGAWFCFQEGHAKSLAIFIDAVLKGPLTTEEKSALILARSGGLPGFHIAAFQNRLETTSVFFHQVLNNDNLSDDVKIAIILAKTERHGSIIELAITTKRDKVIQIFLDKLLSSQLPEERKAEVFSVVLDEILKANRLSDDMKVALVTAAAPTVSAPVRLTLLEKILDINCPLADTQKAQLTDQFPLRQDSAATAIPPVRRGPTVIETVPSGLRVTIERGIDLDIPSAQGPQQSPSSSSSRALAPVKRGPTTTEITPSGLTVIIERGIDLDTPSAQGPQQSPSSSFSRALAPVRRGPTTTEITPSGLTVIIERGIDLDTPSAQGPQQGFSSFSSRFFSSVRHRSATVQNTAQREITSAASSARQVNEYKNTLSKVKEEQAPAPDISPTR